jgi:hypothetical protein
MRRFLAAVAAATFTLALAVSAVAAGGPPAIGFYVDDDPYRTIGTPTDLSNTGAPEHSFDRIYALGPGLVNVAEAKPGDTDYNGGRWMVIPIIWHVAPEQLTDADVVEQYEEDGKLSFGEPTTFFVCPVINVPRDQQ